MASPRLPAQLPCAQPHTWLVPYLAVDSLASNRAMAHSFWWKGALEAGPCQGLVRARRCHRELSWTDGMRPTRAGYGVMLAMMPRERSIVTGTRCLPRSQYPSRARNKVEAVSALDGRSSVLRLSIETVTGHSYRFSGWKRMRSMTCEIH